MSGSRSSSSSTATPVAVTANRVAETLASLASLSLDFSDLDEKPKPHEPPAPVVTVPPPKAESSVVAEAVAAEVVDFADEPRPADDSPPEDDSLSDEAPAPAAKKDSPWVRKTNGHASAKEEPIDDAPQGTSDSRLSALFERVESLLGDQASKESRDYKPRCPQDVNETGLLSEEIERLILKFLLAKGGCSGRGIATQTRLPFAIIDPVLKGLKKDQLVTLVSSAEMGDYVYGITDMGRERARRYMEECTYFGAAPVILKDYLHAMQEQTIAGQIVGVEDLREAFSDLLVNDDMVQKLGPAINSGRGMFLFGEPGNGKTSIAERITQCFGSTIYIPRALCVDGEIVRLYDPGVHEEVVAEQSNGLFDLSGVDPRWVQIVRPTVVAGGELTMAELEITLNQSTRICEAPLQLKSNCGTLVIDDFGRQRMPVTELLNRWIVPLEKRYDFLNLPSGKKVQVPFDQLIIFSTNLEPRDLVDGAFLRRIPYKIKVGDPSEAEFKEIIRRISPKLGFQYDAAAVDHLVAKHYRAVKRPFRSCQPRDLLLQVKNYCAFRDEPRKMTAAAFDFAVANYFSIM